MRLYSSRYSVPSSWEAVTTSSRSQSALTYLKVEGLRVKYVGPGEDDRQAAAIITNHPAPVDCPLFYFEVEILNKGREGYIGIGFQTDDVVLARLPGWEPHSYGYHGDDGHKFSGSGRGQPYAPKFTTGDVIGCLLHRADRTISFFKNGCDLGVAFTNVSEERLHPTVGLRSQGEDVCANFGGQPFVMDFEAMVMAYRDKVDAAVASIPVPLVSSAGLPLLPQLLHDHLLHHRCSQTAAIIARDLLRPQVESSTSGQASASGSGSTPQDNARSADIASRQLIYELVTEGKITQAVQELQQKYKQAPLDNNPALDFRFKVAQFCEILRGTDQNKTGCLSSTEAALAFGRQVLVTHHPKGPAEDELLSDALSLLAYDHPETSPCGHLMRKESRVALAEALNGAILKHQGLPSVSPLERIFQQAAAVLAELRHANHPQAMVLDLSKAVSGPPLTPATADTMRTSARGGGTI